MIGSTWVDARSRSSIPLATHPTRSACSTRRTGLLFGGDTYNTGPIYAHLPDSDVEAFARSTARMAELADGVAFVYVAHFSRYVEIGAFVREVAAGFAEIAAGEALFEQSTDDDGEGARLARFARFGVLVPNPPG